MQAANTQNTAHKTIRPLDIQQLDVCKTPLTGRNLIEASAGTGKTFTVSWLYVRLILEKKRNVDEILVVTYTNAATAELRERLREVLVEMRQAYSAGNSQEFFPQQIMQLYPDREDAITCLTRAIRSFDSASIFTIHGFCQQVLSETALLAKIPFDSALLTDDSDLQQSIVDDFWRRRFAKAPAYLLELYKQKLTPESLREAVSNWLGKPYLDVLLPTFQDDERILDDWYHAYHQAQSLWHSEQTEIIALLKTHDGLKRNSYRVSSIIKWEQDLATYLRKKSPSLTLFKYAERFSDAVLKQSLKKGKTAPKHTFFTLWGEYLDCIERVDVFLKQKRSMLYAELLVHLRAELDTHKQVAGILTFDDLLLRLFNALNSESGEALAQWIRQRWPVALIDEFQDTDPIQYQIFRTVYATSPVVADAINADHKAVDTALFFVGDPKQAIYSFRGADIFTYLTARDDTTAQYTLEKNWRSTTAMVAGANHIFSRHIRPFWSADIAYHKVGVGNAKKFDPVLPADFKAWRFWTMNTANGKAMPKGTAEEHIIEAVANDIADLLNQAAAGRFQLKGEQQRPLSGRDIAVLVRKNEQGLRVKNALNRRGVACVQHSRDNVFLSHEAKELLRVLSSIWHSGQEAKIRAALVTELMGLQGDDLARFETDDSAWEDWLSRFRHWRKLWVQDSFIAMFHALIHELKVHQRMLCYDDGERRLTNLLHLGELLHQHSLGNAQGAKGLLNWFSRQRSHHEEDEALQLRLESDADLVQIVTIHKSKGLEYGLIYCPFLWNENPGKERKTETYEPFMFYHPEKKTSCLDMGSTQQNHWYEQARAEQMAENLRLLYVALTRAKYHCTIVTGHLRDVESSALGWLLYGADSEHEQLSDAIKWIKSLSGEEKQERLDALIEEKPAFMFSEDLPDSEALIVFQGDPNAQDADFSTLKPVKHFQRIINKGYEISSFSALSANEYESIKTVLLSLDTLQGTSEPAEHPINEAQSISDFAHAFPRGALAGSCLHAVFEYLDFTQPVAEQSATIQQALATFGFEEHYNEGLLAWLASLLHGSLSIADYAETEGLSLACLSSQARLNEMAFYYPVQTLNKADLQAVLMSYYSQARIVEAIQELRFETLSGYLKGYIDLVFEYQGRFYIADYKSNVLAETALDYGQDEMIEAIAEHHYYLQYSLYSLALHRYLKQRLPDYDYAQHFGGVYYLFIRGMALEYPSCGVYYDKPSLSVLEALDQLFRDQS